ncbi:MAG TPA: glycosyltransferase family A protein [Terrimesophilobacter sp.]|nr:glycosyltransferase family A protein [Terrimesophilobacter sp.]
MANVRRLSDHAAITISDASGEDDTLPLLRTELASVADLEWLGPRSIAPGWASHCNDLLERSTEEFFAWLPHDDEIGSDWVVHAESRLDAHPDTVLALGTVVPVHEPGVTSGGFRIDPAAFTGSPDGSRIRQAVETCMLGDTSLLGAAFRGVMRRSRAAPLPLTQNEDEWSDILWAVRMLARGPFVAMPATYGKRWHPLSAHASWSDPRQSAAFRTRWLPEALADLGSAEREAILTTIWDIESSALRDRISAERARAEATTRADFERSRSWLLTGPLRRLASRIRARRPSRLGTLGQHGDPVGHDETS